MVRLHHRSHLRHRLCPRPPPAARPSHHSLLCNYPACQPRMTGLHQRVTVRQLSTAAEQPSFVLHHSGSPVTSNTSPPTSPSSFKHCCNIGYLSLGTVLPPSIPLSRPTPSHDPLPNELAGARIPPRFPPNFPHRQLASTLSARAVSSGRQRSPKLRNFNLDGRSQRHPRKAHSSHRYATIRDSVRIKLLLSASEY